jgi:CBS domain-containing protein
MFHIHNFQGVQYNVPLESLKKSKGISSLEKSYLARKLIERKDDKEGKNDDDVKQFSHAVKAYKDAIKIKDEREPILHAYTIMKSPVLTLFPEMKITDAWTLFQEKGVSHMPVLSDEKKLIGIVSDRDLLKRLVIIDNKIENLTDKTVSEVMTKEVITAGRITDIRRIAKAMFEHHIGTMPIVDDAGQLTGIITRSDILYALINYPALRLWA